ncbi:MAG: aromatic amino acid transaminase [Pseudomonadota bacterium]
MRSVLSQLPLRPPDPLLGVMMAYRADPRPDKFDLGVGVYKDTSGKTPIMAAVREAETRIFAHAETKVYQSQRGDEVFNAGIEHLIFGEGATTLSDHRTASFTAPGGCGALFLGIQLSGRLAPEGRVWVSDPSWPNHIGLAQAIGRNVLGYPYLDPAKGGLAFSAMMDALRQAQPGDVLILQGPCHNPTGVDLSEEQWAYMGDFCRRQMIIPLVDIAYHGFGDDFDTDMAGVRAFLEACPSALISYSCSKNFGLYRERVGCFIVQGETVAQATAAGSHVAEIARTCYSMPPAHGAAVVAEILGDEGLRASWTEEVTSMRGRLNTLRQALSEALAEQLGSPALDYINRQKGMFSTLPLTGPMADMVRVQAGVYMPASGRINIAGLSEERIPELAGRLAPYLAQSVSPVG